MASLETTPTRSATDAAAAERSPQTSATEEATEDATESATDEDDDVGQQHHPSLPGSEPGPPLRNSERDPPLAGEPASAGDDDTDWRGERSTRWRPVTSPTHAASSPSRLRRAESPSAPASQPRPAPDATTSLLQAVAGVPTQEHNAYWLYVSRAMLDPDVTDVDDEADTDDNGGGGSSGGVQSTSGKWMLFYRPDRVDRYWLRAVELLAAGQLVGVHAMKVSTARPNPRASSNTHVLIFYCKPCTNRAKVMAAGHRILELFSEYSTMTNYLYYKTDVQTLGGTRATGQTRNWLYRIRLPTSATTATASTARS